LFGIGLDVLYPGVHTLALEFKHSMPGKGLEIISLVTIRMPSLAVTKAVKKWRSAHPDKYLLQTKKNNATFIEWRRISTIFRKILI
jgi:hypothetical protein